ncbi:MAG: histone deacetylase [Vicinamibacteraceae bacterium]|nr:histone deacetylase [Vicinamibacteraceae bacterium]
MRAFYCDHFVLPLPDGHRFPMAKYRLLRERLVAVNGHLIRFEEPAAASWEDLARVHTRAYLEAVRAGTLESREQRRIGFPWSPGMVERSRRSVGGTMAASRAALDEGTAANLAGGTHHAFADRGEGFCVFNDVAVAAHALMAEGRVTRPLVFDCDVHQGNGTAAIFRDDPAVFTCSLHGEKNFPFRKETSDLDVALPDGTGDEEYLEALGSALATAIDRHRPDFVFYVAGADAYHGDRFGRLALTIEGMRARDAFVFTACRTAGLPVSVVMAGGYASEVGDIVVIHANTVVEAARHATRASDGLLRAP